MKKLTNIILIILVALFLTACQSNWKVVTNLTPEAKAKIEGEIITIKATLAEQMKKDGMGEVMAHVNLARAYEKLGDLKGAEKVYKKAVATGINSGAIYNNLGSLYERAGEYNKAIKQYQVMIDTFKENKYLYNITWAYIKAKDFKNAEKYYELWKTTFLKSDVATETELKKLKATQK